LILKQQDLITKNNKILWDGILADDAILLLPALPNQFKSIQRQKVDEKI